MADMKNAHRQSIVSHQHSPRPWRIKRHGLNIDGLCTNNRCPAYNQRVVINLGIGEFDFARILLERKNRCSECLNRIHPTKYALIRCQWRHVRHYSLEEFPLHVVHDRYQWKDLICEYIIIETMSLPVIDQLRSIGQECSICLNAIETNSKSDISYLNCSHVFHQTCINRWLRSREYMANRCPLCRVQISERC